MRNWLSNFSITLIFCNLLVVLSNLTWRDRGSSSKDLFTHLSSKLRPHEHLGGVEVTEMILTIGAQKFDLRVFAHKIKTSGKHCKIWKMRGEIVINQTLGVTSPKTETWGVELQQNSGDKIAIRCKVQGENVAAFTMPVGMEFPVIRASSLPK